MITEADMKEAKAILGDASALIAKSIAAITKQAQTIYDQEIALKDACATLETLAKDTSLSAIAMQAMAVTGYMRAREALRIAEASV